MTTTQTSTAQSILNKSDLNLTADALAKVNAGYALSVVKAVVTGATSLAAQDITSDDTKANAVVTGIAPALADGENLPAIGQVVTLRIVAGTANTGPAIVTDAGGTPTGIAALAAAVATLSDDGTTLTFDAAVTAYTITYIPRAVGITDSFPEASP